MGQLARQLQLMAEVARDIADRAKGTARAEYLDGHARGLHDAYLEVVFNWLDNKPASQ